MPDNLISLKFIYPELIIAFSLILVIIADLVLGEGKRGLITGLSIAGLLAALIGVLELYPNGERALFAGMMALDSFSLFFKLIFILATIFVALFSLRSEEVPSKRIGEYYTILLGVALGMFLMASATDLLMMYLSLELVSVASYILSGYLKDNRASSEAALKYVIYGGVSSGVMIYGMSLIYGLTGSTNIYHINEAISSSDFYGLTLLLTTVFVLAGFGYKIASVPFHFWCPDVYQGAPTPITALLSVAPKAAGFAMLARFFYSGVSVRSGGGDWSALVTDWPYLLSVISAATMTLGNLVAVWQDNVKRLLAYSSIAHAGYILMGVVVLSAQGLKAVMFYLVVYLFMNLGAFLVVIVLSKGLRSEDIKDYNGLAWRSPFVAVSMGVFLFSLTGIPPTAGFVGKFQIFAAVINKEVYWLAVVGVLNSVVSLYYYARIIRIMFLESSTKREGFSISPLHLALIVALLIPTIVLGVYWAPLADLVDRSFILFYE